MNLGCDQCHKGMKYNHLHSKQFCKLIGDSYISFMHANYTFLQLLCVDASVHSSLSILILATTNQYMGCDMMTCDQDLCPLPFT